MSDFAKAMLGSFGASGDIRVRGEKRTGKPLRPADHFEYKRGTNEFTEALINGYERLCRERGIDPWPSGNPW